jgi:hypothetical protein
MLILYLTSILLIEFNHHHNILFKLQKELENIYTERLFWMKQLKKDPVHKKITHTKDTLVENDDFDPEEALEAVVDMRKFIIKRLLKGHKFDEKNDERKLCP